MTAAAETHLIIADDHPLFRNALRQAVASVVASARIDEAGSFEPIDRARRHERIVVEEEDRIGIPGACTGIASARKAHVLLENQRHDIAARAQPGRAVVGRFVIDDDHAPNARIARRARAPG